MVEHQTVRSPTGGSTTLKPINMKCVIALAVLAVVLPAVFSAPRPSLLTGTTLIKSADFLDGAIISAPAAVAIGPAAISSQSTVIAHHAPLLSYAHAAPLAYAHAAPFAFAHTAPFAYAHSLPVVAAAPSLIPAGKTTVVSGPSGTITETEGIGALAYKAW